MIIIDIIIKLDSNVPIFYRQERIITYGEHFKIHMFRTMVYNAEKIGIVVIGNNSRIARVGAKPCNLRLDELSHLIDVLIWDSGIIRTTKKKLGFSRVVAVNSVLL